MLVIGVDPGSRTTGYGIVEARGNRMDVRGFGTITTRQNDDVATRLERMYTGLQEVLGTYGPDEASVEEVFYSKNAKSALILGQARGVVLLTLRMNRIRIYEYSARRVKQGIVGTGAASKKQVQYMIRKLFRLGDRELPEDASDAVAIALCHINIKRFTQKRTV